MGAFLSRQARSQFFFFYGEVRSNEETGTKWGRRGNSLEGGKLWLCETELRGKLQLGGGGGGSLWMRQRESTRGVRGHAPLENV